MRYDENKLKYGLRQCGTFNRTKLLLTQQCQLEKHSVHVLPQLAYSPDLCPADFLFPNAITTLKARRFETAEDVIKNATNDLKVTKQTAFRQCLQKWKRRSER
jgi:hypothetical protein